MARCLIIACGCRGIELARALRSEGHAVRGTTRDRGRVAALVAEGIEPHVGDPDRVATLAAAFDHVSAAVILLGSAAGPADRVRALHTTRLDMILARMLDTTIRGLVYEARGTVGAALLDGGARRVRSVCEDSLIPHAILDADPANPQHWAAAASAAVLGLLGSPVS